MEQTKIGINIITHKKEVCIQKVKYVNEDMIDEILRDDVTKPEK